MPELSKPTRRWSAKGIAIFSVILITLGVATGHFIWGVVAKYQLNKTLARLHDAGEPTAPEDFNFASVPHTQNASVDYRIAGDLINRNSSAWKSWDVTFYGIQPPLTPAESGQAQTILDENKMALTEVDAARDKQIGGWEDNFSNPAMMMNLQLSGPMNVCTLLRIAAMQTDAKGDDATAVQRLSDAVRLSDAAEQRPTLVGHLVAMGCSAHASVSCGWMASEFQVGRKGLTSDALKQLMLQLQSEKAMDDGDRLGWRTERVTGVATLRGMANGTAWAGIMTTPGSPPPSQGTSVAFGYLFKPILLSDAGAYADHLQGVMTAAGAPDWPAAKALMPTKLPGVVAAHPMQHIFISILLPSFDRAIAADYQSRAQRRLAVVALAVRLYAADHANQLPPTLAALVPAYLPAIPIDPMSGTPMKYADNPPRIYRIGRDSIDHGGMPVDPESKEKSKRLNGDLVTYLTTQPRKLPPPDTDH